MSFKVPEKYRTNVVGMENRHSKPGDMHGLFLIPAPRGARYVPLRCIASSGANWVAEGMALPAWEHVSVSPQPPIKRTPTWEEMSLIKSLFWDAEDAVVQYHPPEANYVNWSPYVLHLWRPIDVELPMPPSICVGPVKAVDGGDQGRPTDRDKLCLRSEYGCILAEKTGVKVCTREDQCAVVFSV